MIHRDATHPSHDPHVEHHIEGVRQLDTDLSQWGSWRTHQVGHHIERATLHTAARQSQELLTHGRGLGPVVGGPSILGQLGANEGAMLHPCHIVGVGPVIVATRQLVLIEGNQHSLSHRLGIEEIFFTLGPITPEHRVGLRESHCGGYPFLQGRMGDGLGAVGRRWGAAHWVTLRRSLLEALRILSPEGLILAAPASITQRRLASRKASVKHLQGTPAILARSQYNAALEGSIT